MAATLLLPGNHCPSLQAHRGAPKAGGLTRAAPMLSAIIVNYCQWEETACLVRQLRATPAAAKGDLEIMVVDNRSPSHPTVRKLRRSAGVSLRRWGRNRGYARAVNEGTR